MAYGYDATSILFLPRVFALYIATSEASTNFSAESIEKSGTLATPMLTVILVSMTGKAKPAIDAHILDAACNACSLPVRGRSITNSSPPQRAAVSTFLILS